MNYRAAGCQYTEETLRAAYDYAKTHNIRTVVVASTKGTTGLKATEFGKNCGISTIIVTHNAGFSEPGIQELAEDYQKRIVANGGQLHTGTLVLRGIGSAIRKKFGGSEEELVANVLRLFSQGVKVCVEMAAMVADAGLIPPEDIVCVAGTTKGADTAALIHPAPSNKFFEIKVREIIVKPQDF
ncbi:MAG: hypothetical protein GY762_22840 [Proteobacteria bacterium]|nr:hypothetical protein [Pseudomonadota bacterium]